MELFLIKVINKDLMNLFDQRMVVRPTKEDLNKLHVHTVTSLCTIIVGQSLSINSDQPVF